MDSIPEEFYKWRPRYCDELFADVIEYSKLQSGKTVLEIGPGTGQANLSEKFDFIALFSILLPFIGFSSNMLSFVTRFLKALFLTATFIIEPKFL